MRSMASSPSPKGIAAIVGVGPKLGRSIARKFAHEGYTVAILARDLGQLSRFADEIAREEKAQVFAIRIDCSESRSIKEAFEGVLSLGFVEVLVYNAYHPLSWTPTSFSDIRLDHFEKSVVVSSVGAFHCAQQVLPGMIDRGRGTILFTGCTASLNGIDGYSDLCCGKFALRGLSQSLARELQPMGVHVAHVIIDGIIGTPRGTLPSTCQQSSSSHQRSSSSSVGEQQHAGGGGDGVMDPDVLAQTYWQLHMQDRAIWTQEIDVRPGGPRLC
ncbi:hypothetical protein BUALT_Bualt04G0114900 [Buddleja alternifolia]|uniref:3-ketodihydrosphingosine reductase n=1 Tax=Buddleja alternifolia TaxID=168488 RepID=A0AAV6XPI0_9LAMI|nr:hypothetical protein BUALT_Bualt04G0114900 [Buddleja alternifolia]